MAPAAPLSPPSFNQTQALYIDTDADLIQTATALPPHLLETVPEIGHSSPSLPLRLTRYLSRLIKNPGDPIGRQFLPHPAESRCGPGMDFCAWENAQSPVAMVVHRYPERVLFKVSNRCAAYCRYCFRNPFLKTPENDDTQSRINSALAYIQRTLSIQEVILSGGDPLMLRDTVLSRILHRLRRMPHVLICRIHTRIPAVLPQRVTRPLCKLLNQFRPLYIMVQLNHPAELTPPALAACRRLQASGAILGSQSVLLRGVNDAPHILVRLMNTLLAHGIRPYYLHQLDRVPGVDHYHVPLEEGIQIMSQLRSQVSGMAVPTYMAELPRGGGKIPLQAGAIISRTDGYIRLRCPDGSAADLPL